jgi:hypothetical protein
MKAKTEKGLDSDNSRAKSRNRNIAKTTIITKGSNEKLKV